MTKTDLPQNIETILKKIPRYEVSSELNQKTLRMIENRRQERVWENSMKRPGAGAYVLNFFSLHMKPFVSILTVLALVFGGLFYYQDHSYAHQLSQARKVLAQLQTLLHPERPTATLWVPSAYAYDASVAADTKTEAIDELQVVRLTLKVVAATNKAIDITSTLEAIDQLKVALKEIAEVQQRSLDVFADAVLVVKNDTSAEAVSRAIERTAYEHEQVQQGIEIAHLAESKGDKKAHIVVIKKSAAEDTTTEEPRGQNKTSPGNGNQDGEKKKRQMTKLKVKAETHFKDAVETYAQVGTQVVVTTEELSQLKGKIDTIQSSLDQGEYARAKGLSIALHAKEKNILRRRMQKAKSLLKSNDRPSGADAGFVQAVPTPADSDRSDQNRQESDSEKKEKKGMESRGRRLREINFK